MDDTDRSEYDGIPGAAPHAEPGEGAEDFTDIYVTPGSQAAIAKALTEGADQHGFDQTAITLQGDYFRAPAALVDAIDTELGEASEGGDGGLDPDAEGDPFEGLTTREQYEQFAADHSLTIEGAGGLKADEYKDAVRKAHSERGAQ